MNRSPLSDPEMARELSEIDDFHSYLQRALSLHFSIQGRTNVAEFSRKAGFRSRSYLGEVLLGRKGISRDALIRILAALKLPKPALVLLELLAYRTYPNISAKPIAISMLENRIVMAKQALSSGARLPQIKDKSHLIRKPKVFQVFAALGPVKSGAEIKQIQDRTRLDVDAIAIALNQLIEAGAVKRNGSRYFAQAEQLDFLGLTEYSELADLANQVCASIQQRRDEIVRKKNSMVYSAFSIRGDQADLFAQSLREAIFNVMDRFQDDDGDKVQQLFVCLI